MRNRAGARHDQGGNVGHAHLGHFHAARSACIATRRERGGQLRRGSAMTVRLRGHTARGTLRTSPPRGRPGHAHEHRVLGSHGPVHGVTPVGSRLRLHGVWRATACGCTHRDARCGRRPLCAPRAAHGAFTRTCAKSRLASLGQPSSPTPSHMTLSATVVANVSPATSPQAPALGPGLAPAPAPPLPPSGKDGGTCSCSAASRTTGAFGARPRSATTLCSRAFQNWR